METDKHDSEEQPGTDIVLADIDTDIAQDDAAEAQPELTLSEVDLKNDNAVCDFADATAARKVKAARDKASAYRKIEKANAVIAACDSDLDDLKQMAISKRALAWVRAAHNETKPTPPSRQKKS